MILATWNIRHLNSPIKQNNSKHFNIVNKIVIMGILETKIKKNKTDVVSRNIFSNWDCVFNYKHSPRRRI